MITTTTTEELFSIDLGHILKRIPNSDFSMDTFEGRLRLQKLIYMIQAHGVYLGYDFSWYFRGPYCSTLARAGFALQNQYEEISKVDPKEIKFDEPQFEKKFREACKFIKSNNDTDSLEIAASMHILKHTTDMADDQILEKVSDKLSRFTVEKCQKIWRMMKEGGLV